MQVKPVHIYIYSQYHHFMVNAQSATHLYQYLRIYKTEVVCMRDYKTLNTI